MIKALGNKVPCKHCNSTNTRKNGFVLRRREIAQSYRCDACKRTWTVELETTHKSEE